MTRQTRCIDCNAEGRQTSRAALKPGPRCEEHHRTRKRAISLAAHAKRIEKNFSISSEIYWAIYEFQGGKCFGCQRATGKTKRLAVDHDHSCTAGHEPNVGCIECIRALLCGYCNEVIGRLDVQALQRLIVVLVEKPAQRVIQAMRENCNEPDS